MPRKTQPVASVPLADAVALLGSLEAVKLRARNYSNWYRWHKRQAVPGEYLVPELLACWRAGLSVRLAELGKAAETEEMEMRQGRSLNLVTKVQAHERLTRIFDLTDGEGPEWLTVESVLTHLEEALQLRKAPAVVRSLPRRGER